MTNWKDRIALFAAALWWGSLTSVGFLVVPMLFAHLPTPAVAGSMAGQLFAAQTWVSLVCGLLLLMHVRSSANAIVGSTAQISLMLVAAGVLLALLQQYGVSPRIIARENLKLWHTVGSAMYLAQWLCATLVLWRKAARTA
jgi:hypothetical protein